jgi:hypothetical protein
VDGRTADDAAYWLAQAIPAWRDAVRVVAIEMCSIYASALPAPAAQDALITHRNRQENTVGNRPETHWRVAYPAQLSTYPSHVFGRTPKLSRSLFGLGGVVEAPEV